MSNEVTGVPPDQLNIIQNYIEQCITHHMTLNEIKNTLLIKTRIRPEFTEFAWKNLEQANPEFFKAYHFRLLVKDQVMKFNRLLERQAELMSQLSIKPPDTIHMSNGSDIPQICTDSALYGQDHTGYALQAGDMFQPLHSSLYSNGESSSVHMQGTVDISNDAIRNNTSSNMLMTQSSNMSLMHGMNGLMMPDTGDINGSPCIFGPVDNVLDACHPAGEIPVSSYGRVESHSQLINNNTLLGDDSFYDNLGQIPVASYSRVESHSQLVNNTLLGADASNDNLGQIPRVESHSPLVNNTLLGADVSNDNLGQIPRVESHSQLVNNTLLGADASYNNLGKIPSASYSRVESHSQLVNNTLLGADASYNNLGKIPTASYNRVESHSQLVNNTLLGADASNDNLGKISTASYNRVESHSQLVNNTLLGVDASNDTLGQVPRVESHSQLVNNTFLGTDFSNDNLWQIPRVESHSQLVNNTLLGADVSNENLWQIPRIESHSQLVNNTLLGADASNDNLGQIPRVESHSQRVNNTLLGADASIDNLGQITRNFSLTDLTANILESYAQSPFLAAGSEDNLNPQLHVEQQDNGNLGTISKGLTYDNFRSD